MTAHPPTPTAHPPTRSADRAARLRRRLADARLYLCTDARRHLDPSGGFAALAAFAEEALGGGVDIIQLRDKNSAGEKLHGPLEAGPELRALAVLREVCDRHGALLAVNDRADIARASGADVLHVGQDDLPIAVAREIVGPDVVLGLSCHSADEVDAAADTAGLDYFCTGPVWPTPTKPGRPAPGLDLVRHAAGLPTARPWFAIGGIDAGNVGEVVDAGARRIVVVRALTAAADPRAAARALRDAVTP